MEFWNTQAKQLEKKLQEHLPALMLHFLRTASEESINSIAGEALPLGENARSSVISHLVARLVDQADGKQIRVSPEMATAISANCHHAVSVKQGSNCP
ncbi:hypothetical protein [Stenotrophomonas maltophilia]|uniref:hypothetical protein n=1 Tax=Stenotrophomonas maltophilia TaxID=40324 RepID=UPI000C15D83D|nr:hypothetical protein [Stenotrophomonas maltophilia]